MGSTTVPIDDRSLHPGAEPFVVSPCTKLVLANDGYPFHGLALPGIHPPDRVVVIVNDEFTYSGLFSPNQRLHELGLETLRPHGQAEPFAGFQVGSTVMVLVGFEPYPNSLEVGVFSHQWAALVRVAQAAA